MMLHPRRPYYVSLLRRWHNPLLGLMLNYGHREQQQQRSDVDDTAAPRKICLYKLMIYVSWQLMDHNLASLFCGTVGDENCLWNLFHERYVKARLRGELHCLGIIMLQNATPSEQKMNVISSSPKTVLGIPAAAFLLGLVWSAQVSCLQLFMHGSLRVLNEFCRRVCR